MATENIYNIGDLVTVEGTFTDTAGTVQDPTAIYVRTKAPDGTITTKQSGVDGEVTNPSVGVYRMNVDLAQSGRYYYRVYSTGTYQAAEDQSLLVKAELTAA